SDLLGESPGIRAVREKIARLLDRPADSRRLPPILIEGETGTGKGLLARMIHRAGPRPDGPFVDVNRPAIPEPLPEAEMSRRERRFREDLYHRLAVLTVTLPPLRERGDDVVRLGEHFLARVCADYGVAPKSFADDARRVLRAYAWPGNVRELSNVIERAVLQ